MRRWACANAPEVDGTLLRMIIISRLKLTLGGALASITSGVLCGADNKSICHKSRPQDRFSPAKLGGKPLLCEQRERRLEPRREFWEPFSISTYLYCHTLIKFQSDMYCHAPTKFQNVLHRAQIVPVGSVRFCGWWYAPPPPCMAVRSFGGLRNDFSIDSNVLRHAHKVPEMTEAPSRKVVSDGASGFVWATSV